MRHNCEILFHNFDKKFHICIIKHLLHASVVGIVPLTSQGSLDRFEAVDMGWLRLVGSLKLYVFFPKEPYKSGLCIVLSICILQ